MNADGKATEMTSDESQPIPNGSIAIKSSTPHSRVEDDQQEQQTIYDKSDAVKQHGINQKLKRKLKHIWKGGNQDIDPHSYPRYKKIIILIIVATAGCVSPFATSIYLPAMVEMQDALNTSDTAINASLAVFIFVTALFPLFWGTLGDLFGRRPIYLVSFLIAVAGNICSAFSVNITMFIIFRAISAIGSSSVMSTGAGTISDIFGAHERGTAMAYYTTGPLLGPALGPIVGGYLNDGLGWKSIFYFLTIFCFVVWVAILFFLPETFRPGAHPATHPIDGTMKKTQRITNPVAALDIMRYPNIILTVSFIGIMFLVNYLTNTNFTRIYTNQYGLDSGTVGLCYLSSAVGNMIGGYVGGRLSDRLYNKRRAEAGGEVYPEMRLGGIHFYSAMVIQMLALVAYGWCIDQDVHFAAGLACLFCLGYAITLPSVTLSAYIVDCFRKRSASVTACNNFVRYMMAGIGCLIAADINRISRPGVLYTVCGGILFLSSVHMIIIRLKGKKWSQQRKELGIC